MLGLRRFLREQPTPEPVLPQLHFKKLSPYAFLPTRGTPAAVGLDLYALEATHISSHRIAMVRTGIAVAVPPGYYGRIAPRSGLAAKQGVGVLAGVIDADYRGELIVMLTSHREGLWHHEIQRGDRIAQLILERADIFDPVEVEELDNTVRGEKGFGSSGA